MNLHPNFYSLFIDPLLGSSRNRIVRHIPENSTVLDIACGTGLLAKEMRSRANHVTAIDLDITMVEYASKKYRGEGLEFLIADAGDLSRFEDNQFDLATLSMALHQFPPDQIDGIIASVNRVCRTMLILDYSFPMTAGVNKAIVYAIERMAGREHYTNFQYYNSQGGVEKLFRRNNIDCRLIEISGSGVFSLYKAGNPG